MLSRVSCGGGDPDSYQLNVPALAVHGLVVGRNNDSDIVLNTEVLPLLISRQHARLTIVGHALLLEDSGSTNGTYVNEDRLSPNVPKEILNGNVISFGGPRLIIKDNQQLQNPFVYRVSGIESVTGQARSQQDHDYAATQPADAPVNQVAAVPAPAAFDTSAAPIVEASVDLTRASSSEASIVDLTGSPVVNVDNQPFRTAQRPAANLLSQQPSSHGMQQQQQQQQQQQKRDCRAMLSNAMAGQKRTKPTNEPAVVTATQPQAPSSDGGAKQALENEFECTICRDFMVATHSVVPCGHMFCGECLSEWLQKNPSCPKCRAAATAPPVRTMAVDNVLESLVEKGMSKEDLQERKQRRQHWEAHAGVINLKMKTLFQHHAHRAPHAAFHGYQLMEREAFAAMQQGLGMLINAPVHRQPPRRAPLPVTYTVTTNESTSRILCKGCRNPIVPRGMQIGYPERGQMRWYHLGCLSGDRWQIAAAPGRLTGLPQLHPNQQGDVHRRIHATRPTR